MSEEAVINILGESDNTGYGEDGSQILTWSVDTKYFSSIFATQTYHCFKVVIKNGVVVAYDGNS